MNSHLLLFAFHDEKVERFAWLNDDLIGEASRDQYHLARPDLLGLCPNESGATNLAVIHAFIPRAPVLYFTAVGYGCLTSLRREDVGPILVNFSAGFAIPPRDLKGELANAADRIKGQRALLGICGPEYQCVLGLRADQKNKTGQENDCNSYGQSTPWELSDFD
jgi:hypothetical protein